MAWKELQAYDHCEEKTDHLRNQMIKLLGKAIADSMAYIKLDSARISIEDALQKEKDAHWMTKAHLSDEQLHSKKLKSRSVWGWIVAGMVAVIEAVIIILVAK
jgi:hypothetical protein